MPESQNPDDLQIFTSLDRASALTDHPDSRVVQKRSRTVVRQINVPFKVGTEHGFMSGEAGDYLATNHPDDDPSSDVWPISAARFAATYEEIS